MNGGTRAACSGRGSEASLLAQGDGKHAADRLRRARLRIRRIESGREGPHSAAFRPRF